MFRQHKTKAAATSTDEENKYKKFSATLLLPQTNFPMRSTNEQALQAVCSDQTYAAQLQDAERKETFGKTK